MHARPTLFPLASALLDLPFLEGVTGTPGEKRKRKVRFLLFCGVFLILKMVPQFPAELTAGLAVVCAF